MSSTIEQVKEVILKHSGRASKHQIARELKISSDYAGLILGELKRKREIAFSSGFYVLTSNKSDANQCKEQQKLAIPSNRIGLGRRSMKKLGTKKHAPHPLNSILGISESLVRILKKAGYDTIESLAGAPIKKLMDTTKLELHTAARLINQARKVK